MNVTHHERGAMKGGLISPQGWKMEYAGWDPAEAWARTVELVLSDRWRDELEVEAIRVDRPDAGRLEARGSVVLRLLNLRVEAADSLEVKFLPDHEDVLLHAREVALFSQHKGYGHRTENVAAATMANEHVSFWQQP